MPKFTVFAKKQFSTKLRVMIANMKIVFVKLQHETHPFKRFLVPNLLFLLLLKTSMF